MNMNAVGIDVSKRKSTVAILRPGGKVVVNPSMSPICPLISSLLKGSLENWRARHALSWSALDATMNR